MGQALYRKYRPKTLKEVAGQKHIVTVLSNAIKSGNISHAYLFTGPRGVGKTSIARILAHEINSLPYNDESSHIDIIEIDAASNRRIDEIRDLREKVNISPAEARYKVYIIDEVHMLTKEAFNALLKTLEEPPQHVVFILATTDAHKVPETIISRTQRFVFKPIDIGEMADQIMNIAKKEKINIDQSTAESIAAHGRGSFRDSLSLLDQVSGVGNDQKIFQSLVAEIIGQPDSASVKSLANSIISKSSPAELLNLLDQAYDSGAVVSEISKSLLQEIRRRIIENKIEASNDLITLLDDLLSVGSASDPQGQLEISLFKYLASDNDHAPVAIKSEIPAVGTTEEKVPDNKADGKNLKVELNNETLGENHWTLVLDSLKSRHNTLYGVIRMAEPRFGDDKLTLAFEFSFHQKRASEKANYQKLNEIIKEVSGHSIEIEAIVDKNKVPTPIKPQKNIEKDPSIEAISNIFDGAELLES